MSGNQPSARKRDARKSRKFIIPFSDFPRLRLYVAQFEDKLGHKPAFQKMFKAEKDYIEAVELLEEKEAAYADAMLRNLSQKEKQSLERSFKMARDNKIVAEGKYHASVDHILSNTPMARRGK